MKREVLYAKLQGTDAFVPGVGGLGSTLPPLNRTLSLKMFHNETAATLEISVNGKECFIPITNVQIAVYAPSDKNESVKAVKVVNG